MTIKEAFIKAKRSPYYDPKKVPHLVSCVDFGEFWGFGFSPITLEEGGICYGYHAVPKTGGEAYVFNPTQNLDLLDTAKEIPLDEVLT